jgi:Uma2 family endonuclease
MPLTETPPADGWSADDLDAMPDDGVRRELIDGVLLVAPTQTSVHQVLTARLGVALDQTCPDHLFVTQANEVRLDSQLVFRPDVLVTTFEAACRRTNSFTADEVVLTAEIVSPSSRSLDRVLKPTLYAKAGIPHYWLIETEGDLTVHTYRLNSAARAYVASGSFTDVIRVDDPWRMEIPVGRLRPRNY